MAKKMSSSQFDAMFASGAEVSPTERTAMKAFLNLLVQMTFENRKYGSLAEVTTTKYRRADVDTELVLKIADLAEAHIRQIKHKLNGGGDHSSNDEE